MVSKKKGETYTTSAAAELETKTSCSSDLDVYGGLRIMRPKRAKPQDIIRPTRAEVSLSALRHNVHVLSKMAGQANVWAVLKADGYGHGAPAIARTLERAGVKGFCVALLEEGIELREAGIETPILVMGGYYGRAYVELIERRLTPIVYDHGHLEGLRAARKMLGLELPISVHLKVDTGMARLGVKLDKLETYLDLVTSYPEIEIGGLMTHFANADSDDDASLTEQLTLFQAAKKILLERKLTPPIFHAANSAALLRGAGLYHVVRPGIALFGVNPLSPRLSSDRSGLAGQKIDDEIRPKVDLRPVMRVRTEVISLRELNPGDKVGYGSLYTATKPTRVATVPIGYADGYTRYHSGKGQMIVRGRKASVLGAVSMDMTTLDVTEIEHVSLGDEVIVMGSQGGQRSIKEPGAPCILAEDLAKDLNTIPWEVIATISRRVPRFYVDD